MTSLVFFLTILSRRSVFAASAQLFGGESRYADLWIERLESGPEETADDVGTS